jgi:hypothetical protein
MRSRRRPCVRLIRYKLNCSSELRSLARADRAGDPPLSLAAWPVSLVSALIAAAATTEAKQLIDRSISFLIEEIRASNVA